MRPPLVPSAEFTADFEYTLAYGSINSTNRTAYETDTAKFWYDETTGMLAEEHAVLRNPHFGIPDLA